jgi:hypothetical protein
MKMEAVLTSPPRRPILEGDILQSLTTLLTNAVQIRLNQKNAFKATLLCNQPSAGLEKNSPTYRLRM